GGYELLTQTGSTCGPGTHLDQNVVRVSRNGDIQIVSTARLKDGDPNCAVGRRPEGLVRRAPTARIATSDALGDYLAEMAYLEAASVPAFERLARELRAHGAPARLVRAAERARDDEVRHAKTTAMLAARYGRSVAAPIVQEMPTRDLVAVAIENATEG